MSTPAPVRVSRGPVRDSERSIAPDLARGFALLFIALANTPFYLWGAAETGLTSAHPVSGSVVDQVVQFLIMLVVDGRTYPLFAFLFGYGMVQLYRRQIAGGADDKTVRRLLRARNWWLLAFGFVHALLLWMGDVLGAYGLAGLVLVALFFRRKDRTLMVWAWILTGLLALFSVFAMVGGWFSSMVDLDPEMFEAGGFDMHAGAAESNYLLSMLTRVGFWFVVVAGQGLVGLVVPIMILVAFWAARRGVLDNPGEHLRLLKWTAVVGIAVGWLGALPGALVHLGVIDLPLHASWMFAGLTAFTGMFAGLGYAAVFGLIGHAMQGRERRTRLGFTGAVMAVGKRSLSCYLMQSVLCAPLLSAWGLGWGGHMSSAEMALFAIAVWAVTLVLAAIWESRGWRGPAETLLRRLVYRR
ncbi:DUF418 domain-containing protein [Microbacterium amylolyticum]|uniref:Membrane protein YeiB n=1 Tax=Microbacterium amylolyticum TaxID=936337 RepID=A0ABS4ZJM1_9MICO|nr:DUF418 domain-containing protein [Microbacterium amylolyticum]MBP2437487.1 putative membrane protein YeiB [Microbacterium amylolyticum]